MLQFHIVYDAQHFYRSNFQCNQSESLTIYSVLVELFATLIIKAMYKDNSFYADLISMVLGSKLNIPPPGSLKAEGGFCSALINHLLYQCKLRRNIIAELEISDVSYVQDVTHSIYK